MKAPSSTKHVKKLVKKQHRQQGNDFSPSLSQNNHRITISVVVKSLSEAMVKLKKQKLQNNKSSLPQSPLSKGKPSLPKGKPNRKGTVLQHTKSQKNTPAEVTNDKNLKNKRSNIDTSQGIERDASTLKKQRQSQKPNFQLVKFKTRTLFEKIALDFYF